MMSPHASFATLRGLTLARLWTLLTLVIGALPGTQDTALAAAPVSKEVLAFYYGWYGNPQVSGKWVHWREVGAAKKTISGSTHYPALGAYDSHDPKVVEQHCREAKEAGLTGLIATWWAQNDFHDQGLPLISINLVDHEFFESL